MPLIHLDQSLNMKRLMNHLLTDLERTDGDLLLRSPTVTENKILLDQMVSDTESETLSTTTQMSLITLELLLQKVSFKKQDNTPRIRKISLVQMVLDTE